MRKIYSLILVISILLTTGVGCFRQSPQSVNKEPKTLTIYAYDSLTSEWGFVTKVIGKFESENNVKTKIISFSDTGKMLNQLILEKQAPKADVVIGLDNLDFVKAMSNGVLESFKPARAFEVSSTYWFDDKFSMTPFDYGYVGFVYDSKKIDLSQPISLKDLSKDNYKKKIIIEQAGASSPGTQLLLWSKLALSKNDYTEFWNGLKKNVLTVAPDWGTAYYSLFIKGEAPIVLSYLTSPAYHIDQETNFQYKAVPIKEGYLRQVEGMAVIKGASEQELAKIFVDYILTNDVQDQIATTQWMFPVLGDPQKMPIAYGQIITPKSHEILIPSSTVLAGEFISWLNEWNKLFGVK
jgi:thiamine transport system substrate-binding protein